MNNRENQFTLRTLLILTAVIFVGLGVWVWLIHPVTRHQAARNEMEIVILSLSKQCPKALTADQWAYCIKCTWNLHANYGYYQAIEARDLEQIAAGLQERVDQGPDLATIDWVWDQYMELYPRARAYEQYRPTARENREDFEAGAHSGYFLAWYQGEYRRRVIELGRKP